MPAYVRRRHATATACSTSARPGLHARRDVRHVVPGGIVHEHGHRRGVAVGRRLRRRHGVGTATRPSCVDDRGRRASRSWSTAPTPTARPGPSLTRRHAPSPGPTVVTNTGHDARSPDVTVVDDNGTPGIPADDFSPTFVGGDTNRNGLLDLAETWTLPAPPARSSPGSTPTSAPSPATRRPPADADRHRPGHTTSAPTPGDRHREAGQRPGRRRRARPEPGRRQHGHLHLHRHQHRQRARGRRHGRRRQRHAGHPGRRLQPDLHRRRHQQQRPARPRARPGPTPRVGHGRRRPVHATSARVTGTGRRHCDRVSDTDPANYFGVTPGINIEKLVNGHDADTPTGPILPVGSTATFTYIVTNTGTSCRSPASPSSTTTARRATRPTTSPDLHRRRHQQQRPARPRARPGPSRATPPSSPAGYTNIGTAPASRRHQPTSATPTRPTTSAPPPRHQHREAGQRPRTPTRRTGPSPAVGSTVTFTYMVTNTGNDRRRQRRGRRRQRHAGQPGRRLQPDLHRRRHQQQRPARLGRDWTYQPPATVVAGQYTNIGTRHRHRGAAGTDTDPAHYFGAVARRSTSKAGQRRRTPTRPTGPILPVGSTVTFTYIVTNTGNVPLASVMVVDDNGTPGDPADDFNPIFVGGDTNSNGLLDLGRDLDLHRPGHRRRRPVHQHRHGRRRHRPPGRRHRPGQLLRRRPPPAAIDIEKLVNGTDADSPTGPILPRRQHGHLHLRRHQHRQRAARRRRRSSTTTARRPTRPTTSTRPSTAATADPTACSTWPRRGPSPPPAPPSPASTQHRHGHRHRRRRRRDRHRPATRLRARRPGINLAKLVNGTTPTRRTGPSVPVGSTVTFTYLVTNTGNVPLAGVTVSDDNGTPADPADDFNADLRRRRHRPDGLLDPRETWTFTASARPSPASTPTSATATGTRARRPP